MKQFFSLLSLSALLALGACTNFTQQPQMAQEPAAQYANTQAVEQYVPEAPASIIGTWQVTTISGDGVTVDLKQQGNRMTIVFNEDGSGFVHRIDNLGFEDSDSMKWTREGNLIKIVTMSDGETDSFAIQSLSQSELVMTGLLDGINTTLTCVRGR